MTESKLQAEEYAKLGHSQRGGEDRFPHTNVLTVSRREIVHQHYNV